MIAIAVLILLAIELLFGAAHHDGSTRRGGGTAAADVVHEVATIARRDEAIRGLRFKHVPAPLLVSPAQARRDALADFDRTYPAARRAADQETLELLGLLPPRTDLRAVEGQVSGQEVAGYYDTQRKRLAVVQGPASNDRVAAEITLSHELNHALEDQRFGLTDVSGSGADDAGSAYTALVEGTATAVMGEYTRRYISAIGALGSALSQLSSGSGSTRGVPPYLQRSLEFSYFAGQRFVDRLYAAGHGSWRLVNRTLAGHPPVSTAQVIHPEKYLSGERPLRVSMPALARLLGRGWRRASAGTIGEFDTAQLLQLGVDGATAARAAAGWGGGRYELWQSAPRPAGCATPCRQTDVLVLTWRWDTRRDAAEAGAALARYATRRGGAAPVLARGAARTALAFAPTRALARRLAAAAAGRSAR